MVLKTEPAIDYPRIGELSREFTDLWDRLHALYLDSAVGFLSLKRHLDDEQDRARAKVSGTICDSEAFQDDRIFTYDGILDPDLCMSHLQMPKQGIVKRRNSKDGDNFNSLGQLCVTAFYDYWNERMRFEYVVAKGKLDRSEQDQKLVQAAMREYASFAIWGDMRRFRVSIVHNLGIAIQEVEKCEVFKWFKRGDKILFTPARMRDIFLALLEFRNILDSEQYPETYIQL